MAGDKLKTYVQTQGAATTDEAGARARAKRLLNRWFYGAGAFLAVALLIAGASEMAARSERKAEAASGPPGVQAASDAKPPVLQGQAQALYDAFMGEAEPCNVARTAVAASFNVPDADAYSTFPVVSRAHDICRSAWIGVSSLSAPKDADEETRSAYEKALETCSVAYGARTESLKQLKAMLDGDGRPSVAAEAQELQTLAEQGLGQCIPGLMLLTDQLGGKVEGLTIDR